MPAENALTRFSDRVEDYIRYRPGYPPEVVETLTREFGLRASHVIADIGSGTGLSAELFLRNDNTVCGVEPNTEMRAAAEKLLSHDRQFQSVNGKAEATTLPDASVDWVIAAQAFHWFDVDAARREFRRILRPGGRVALIWNDRRADTPFLRDYEALIRQFAIDYDRINHQNAEKDGRIERFFGGPCVQRTFPNAQRFDFHGVCGRLSSSSYIPKTGHPFFQPMIDELRRIFHRHAIRGRITFEYETKMWIGSISE